MSATVSRQSRTVQDSNRAALTTPVGRVSNQPSGLLLSPRFPTPRNVYQERGRQTFRAGDFFRGGWYRTRTARHRRRRGSKHPSGVFVSARFPTARNVYRDDCRFVVDGTGREPERAKAGYHRGDGILPFVLICFISRSQHPLQYSLRENSP